jgi:hypothetical protein
VIWLASAESRLVRPHLNETEPAAVKLCTTRFEIVAGE